MDSSSLLFYIDKEDTLKELRERNDAREYGSPLKAAQRSPGLGHKP